MAKLLSASSSALIFLILCVTTFTNLVTSQSSLVSTFCNKVQDPKFCLGVINSDPRSKTAKTIHDLEGITIDLGSKNAIAVATKALSLAQNEKDPNKKAALSSCIRDYSLLNIDFSSIRAAFQAGRTIGEPASDARLAVNKCDQAFNEKKLTSPLADDNDKLLSFIQIILANGMSV